MDIDFDNYSTEELERMAGIASQTQIHAQKAAPQIAQTPQAVGGTIDYDSLSTEELERMAFGGAQTQPIAQPTAQTGAGGQDALSDAEWAEVQKGVVNEGDTPLSKGVESFMDSWFGQGRKDAMDNYRRQTRDGGVGGSVLGYLSDLGNSFWAGLVGGGAKIAEAAGHLTGSDGLVQGSKGFEAGVNEYMPTDMTDTAQRFDENGVPVERTWGQRIADEGKNVVRMAGEFAPASIPGVGGAYTYANIGAGGVNRYNELVKEAMDNGLSKAQARIIGGAGGAIDVFSNAFLMGKFRGKGVPPIEDRYFKSFIGKMLSGAAKTAGVMGVSGGFQDALQQMAENGDFDIERTGNAVLDGAIQGAMFHVMNEGLHAPVKWSAAKAKRAADARRAEMADVDSMRADAAEEAKAERDARISADLAAQSAMKVLEEPLGVAKFIQQNQDASLDIINARRLGRDVDMDALLADGPEGIPDVLKPAFRTQQYANAFGDRLLEYYYNGRKAEKRAQRESGIRQAFEDYDRRNAEEYIADQDMRERWANNLEAGRSEKAASRARRNREEDIRAAFADHDRSVAERRQELAKKRADRIAGKIEDDVRAADESRVAQDAMELADRDAELKAMREANKGREKSVAEEAREEARIQREEKANADAQDRATAEDAARYDAEVEDAATRFRNGDGIPSYEQWLGNRADTKVMRWKYDAMVNEAARKMIGMPEAKAEEAPQKTEKVAEQAPVADSSPVAEAAPQTAENGARKPVSEMTKQDINARFKELVDEANKALEGDSTERAHAAANALDDFKKEVTDDGRFNIFQSMEQDGVIPKSVDVFEKSTDADYKAYLKKNGYRDSRKHRTIFEQVWRKEHRETVEKGTVDAPVAEAVNQPTETREAPTEAQGEDSAYRAWLAKQTGRDGKPKADSGAMRMQYETLVKRIEETKNILSSLKRISSYENILPRVSSEKLIETLNDIRAKDPNYADMISKVRDELERRGKLPSEPPKTAKGPQKDKRTAPNQGYSYEDYAGETGDDIGHAILRDGPKLNIPEGLMEYRRAVANWNKLKDKSSRPKPKMSDFGVTDPSADFINNLLDGASRADRIRLFGFKPAKGSNDGFSERLHDPALRAEFDRYAEQHGASAALERFASDILGAYERYGRWSSKKRIAEADRKAENEILNERMEDLLKAENDENAEWDSALGEIESGDEGFGANGEYIIPFSRARLSQAKRGDIIRFGKDKAEFTLRGFDKDSGVMEVVGEDGGNPRFFEVSENGVKEVRDGRNEKESVQNHDRDENGERRGQGEGGEGGEGEFQLESATPEQLEAERVRLRQREEIARRQAQPIKGGGEYGQTLMDLGGAEGEDLFNRTAPAQGDAPAKPETDIKALGAAAKKAMQDLRSMGAVNDRTLESYSRQWRKQKGDRFQRMADAADTVLKYREAVKNQPPSDGGAFRGSAEDAGETRYSRTVSDAERSDPSVVSRIADRLSRLVPGVKVKVAELSPDERAAGAVASYDRRTGTATFSPDANLSDVVHEIGGHAIRQWAERNCPELLRKAVEYARNAPREIKDYVYRNYADRRADGSYVYDGNALLDEIFAHRFAKEHGEEFRRMLEEKPKARKWWANISNAVRSVFQNAAKRNGVDTESLKGLDAEAYMKGVAEQLVAGKELNEWTAFGRDAKWLGAKAAPVGVGGDDGSRRSIGGIYTGSAADYAEKDADGKVENGPSLKKIGTGEGNQVYGWGLYGSSEQGVADKYAERSASKVDNRTSYYRGVEASMVKDGRAQMPMMYIEQRGGVDNAIEYLRDVVAKDPKANIARKALEQLEKNKSDYEYKEGSKYVYEQTFFTNRKPGDESHLLSWYEPVSEENLGRILEGLKKEGISDRFKDMYWLRYKGMSSYLKTNDIHGAILDNGSTGDAVYQQLTSILGSPKDASEFLARADIDGIKYPVDSYGKQVKDGDAAGWNYVSFRDDNIRVDHKWRDGEQMYSRRADEREDVRVTRSGNTITFGRRANENDNGMHDSGLREGGRDVGGGSPDRLSFVERTSYRPNRIHDLFRSLNSDADSSALAERVFAAADSLGARFGFGDIRKVSKNEDAVGAERMGRALYDSEYFARGDVNDQVKADKILHEAIHSVTSYALSITDGGHALSDVGRVNARLRKATSDLRDVYLQSLDRLGDAYGAKNEYEFVAELSNPSFRSKLKKIGVWDRTVNAVKRIIDSVLGTNLSKTNANDAAMRALDRILENGDREAFYTARKFAADRDPVAEREFGDPVDSDGETMYSRRSYDDRELRDLISFKPGDMKISRKEIDNGYRQASVRSGVLARRIEALLGNDEGGRARVGSGDAGGARQARELAGVQGEGRTNEGALERVLRGVSEPLGKWRTDPEIGLRNSTSPFPDGEMSKIGGESEVFYDKKHGDVLKLRNLDSFEGIRLPHIPQYANDFNFFFGKFSPITIDSFGVTRYGNGVKGVPNEIIRQKYAEFKKDGWEEALAKIHEDLSRRFPGMKWLGNEIAQIGNKRISDLHSDNLGIDVRTGKPFVRDCNIDSAGDYSYETERSPTMYSRRAQRSANGPKSVDEKESFGTKLRRAVQDNLIGWRNVQDETGGVRDVVDNNTGHTDFRKSTDFYEAKDRQNGYEEKEMRALQRTRDRIDETLVDAGVSNDDFGKFLALRHAEERNRAIAKKNGVAFTMGYADGAGISSSRANSMLAAMLADPAKKAALYSAGNAYDAMMRADLDRRLASGRISQDDYDNLSQYKHYAPLRRDQSSDALGMFNSSTGGMKKNEFVGAKGLGADRLFDQNGNLTVNPYEFGLIQAQEGIRGSLENESRLVLRNLVNLANSRGNTLGEIVDGQAMPRGAGYTFEFGNGDRVVADSGYNIAGNRRDVVLFKDGGRLKAIRIDAGENGNGLMLADAANGRDMAKWNKALEWIPKMTRAMAAMRTQYVPTFIARNFKADTLEAMTAALGRFGVKDAASIAKDMVKAEVSNAKDLKAYIKDGTLNGYVREAVEGGLLTKGGTASQGFDDMVSKIKNHRAKLEREKKAWYRRGTIDNAKQLLSTLGESISMMNEFAENSTRIGMFTALRKLRTKQYPNGVPINEAVKFCRDATTNFNRHGWLTPYINGAFMFSNAATQGMTRNIQAIRDVHGRQLVGTLIALGTAEALVNHYFGNDDERENDGKGNARNLSEYEKKHQIGVPIGGGRQAIWQTRGLYATIPYLARTAVDAMLGETKVPDALMNVLSEAGSVATEPLSGNGLSSKATAMQSLSPTLVDPLVQWVSGKDYKGDDRIAKSYNANKPLSWNGKGKTSEGYKWFAKLVNSATGGNEGRKGLVDMAPEDVQLIVETIVGGIGRDVSQIGSGIQTARQLADGESPERVLGETAFMRDWVREYPNVGSRYYAAVNRLDAMKTELASKKTYEEKSAYVRENPIAATKRTKVLEKMEKTIRDYQALGRGMSKDKSGKYVENPHVSAESKKRYNDLAAKMMARFVKEVEKDN